MYIPREANEQAHLAAHRELLEDSQGFDVYFLQIYFALVLNEVLIHQKKKIHQLESILYPKDLKS